MSRSKMLARLCRSGLMMLAAILTLTTSGALQPVQAQAPQQTVIAFDNGGNIWTMNPDGSNQTKVSDVLGVNPALSPDGKKIAFLCGAEPFDVCVMNVDGSNLIALTSTQNNITPTWSPDGSRIAFTSFRDNGQHVYIMNADGSNVQRLVVNNLDINSEDYATWSPDGSKIAFVGYTENASELYIVNVNGSGPVTQLTTSEIFKFNLAWSPDGNKIAFDTDDNIYTVNADGSGGLNLLTSAGDQNTSPAWSPDGSQIAFYRKTILRDENGANIGNVDGLFVMPSLGGTATSLNAPRSYSPSWGIVPALDPDPTPTPAKRISDLIALVKSFNLHHGLTNSLTVKLQHALRALNAGNPEGACDGLKAFINEVNAQSGKKLPAVQAGQLSTEAASIRLALGCV